MQTKYLGFFLSIHTVNKKKRESKEKRLFEGRHFFNGKYTKEDTFSV